MAEFLAIGADPGKSGAIAFIRGSDIWTVSNESTDRDLLDSLRDAVFAEGSDFHAFALLEKVSGGGFAGKRQSGAFEFGRQYGRLEMLFAATNVPFERITPQQWQKQMQCLTKGDKNVSKRRAQELFPHLRITHRTADALLLAELCRRNKSP